MEKVPHTILDRNGSWFLNSLQFQFVDLLGQVFKPGHYTQATPSAWTEGQVAAGVLTETRSPLLSDDEIAKLDAADAAEAKAKAKADAAAAAEKASQGKAPADKV